MSHIVHLFSPLQFDLVSLLSFIIVVLVPPPANGFWFIMAYLPKEKLLVEADAYTPGPPNAPPPARANPFSVNLHENIERLKLEVDQILPLHGRIVPLGELLKAIGKNP
ncbi:MAG: hypothetical protein ACREQA_01090 [Candidatus Binatia bacterium]